MGDQGAVSDREQHVLGLIENVRRMALRTVQRLDELEVADKAARRVADAADEGKAALDAELDRFAADPPPLTPTFVSRFLHQLRVEGGALPAVVRLEQWIADEALSAEDATTRSTQRLALTQVVMANSITSLRAIGLMEWRTFVEAQSRIDTVLRQDPSGFYSRMTFATRDYYRHAVERIAKSTRRSEEGIARRAVELAHAGMKQNGSDLRRSHVGYYLIDAGLAEAGAGHISFVDNRKFLPQLSTTRASACLVAPAFAQRVPEPTTALVMDAPYRGFALALQHFYPDALFPKAAMAAAGDPLVHPSARLEEDVRIEPGAVVGSEAQIGRGTVIAAGAVIGYRVTVGRGSSSLAICMTRVWPTLSA
jgi:predicted transcriptional regulator